MTETMAAVADRDKITSNDNLNNHNNSRGANHNTHAKRIGPTAKHNTTSFAEIAHDVLYRTIAKLMAIVDKVNIIAEAAWQYTHAPDGSAPA